MTNRTVTCICENVTKVAAQAICTAFGDGPGTFSVPLSTMQGVTDRALATHWAMQGDIPEEECAALSVSLDPKVWVFDAPGGDLAAFEANLAACHPPLFRVIEGL